MASTLQIEKAVKEYNEIMRSTTHEFQLACIGRVPDAADPSNGRVNAEAAAIRVTEIRARRKAAREKLEATAAKGKYGKLQFTWSDDRAKWISWGGTPTKADRMRAKGYVREYGGARGDGSDAWGSR